MKARKKKADNKPSRITRTLRYLTDEDITRILGAVGEVKLCEERRCIFKETINALIEPRIANEGRSPLPKRLEQLKRINSAVKRLEGALQRFDAKTYFPYVHDLASSSEEDLHRGLWPATSMVIREFKLRIRLMATMMTFRKVNARQLEPHGFPIDHQWTLVSPTAGPSAGATRIVTSAIDGVHLLGELARAAELQISQLRSTRLHTTKKQEAERYAFIIALSYLYEKLFQRKARATRMSNWYSFLAAVLTSCEGRNWDSSNVHRVFERAKSWAEATSEDERARTLIPAMKSVASGLPSEVPD